jgi:hypothetical protein
MSSRRLLLTLLIHQNTRDQYYHKHDLFVEKQKKWLEDIRQEPFDALPKDMQTYYQDSWFWPPWRFNDIVGFAEIELETDWTVIGHLYLPEGRASKISKKSLLLNYACASASSIQGNLQNLREAIISVTDQLQLILAECKWRLEFSQELVNYTDFLMMIRDREQRSVK